MSFILLANLFLFFILRFLMKRNIFLKKLGYVFILGQAIVFISTPVRIHSRALNLNNFPVEYIACMLVILSSSAVLLPLLIDKVLSEKKKEKMQNLEERLTVFLYERLEEIRVFLAKNIWFWENFETVFLNSCLKLCFFMLSYRDFFFGFFLIIPWSFFIFAFFKDFLFNGSGYLSIYAFSFFIFLPRVFSLLLFFSKRALFTRFKAKYLLCSPHTFYITIGNLDLLNFQIFINLLFQPAPELNIKSKKDLVILWNQVNLVLILYIYFTLTQNYWRTNLPRAKQLCNTINLLSLILVLLLKISVIFFCWYLVIFVITISKLYWEYKMVKLDEAFATFLLQLPGNIGFLQRALRVEKGFTYAEVATVNYNLISLPQNRFHIKDWLGFTLLIAPGIILLFNFEPEVLFYARIF